MTNRELKTFNELLYENEIKYADMVYLRQPINGVWHEITWKEAMLRARKVTTFLKGLGLKKNDTVSIFSKNCAEWIIADFAIAMGGFISVPIYPAQSKESIRYVLDHAEVKVIFVGKLDNWQSQEAGIPEHVIRIAFPYDNAMPAKYQWNDLLAECEPDLDNYVPDLDDIYTIPYTSGTTGKPKGVMISFGAQAHAKATMLEEGIMNKVEHNFLLSYLPLGHIYERTMIEYSSLIIKTTISFVESLPTFAQNLRDTAPTMFAGIPRIWAQFQKAILEKLPQNRLNILLKIPLVNSFIKKTIKQSLGLQRSVANASGSAPISPALLEWYKRLGIEVVEGYGRTEDLAIITAGKPGRHKIGTVGRARPHVEIKIDENGEILTRSKMMMSGYYKDLEATKKAFTKDGFLRTGDLGHFDEDGNLIIQGRVDDSFKTDKGEFINPIAIEAQFEHNTHIEQLCLIGLSLPQPVLLAVLTESAKRMDRQVVAKSLKATLDVVNTNLVRHEKVAHIFVVVDAWTPENSLLTPTLKLRRNAIHQKYIELAKKNVDNPEAIIWEKP